MILKLLQTELKRSTRLIIPFILETFVIILLLSAALFLFLGSHNNFTAAIKQTIAISAPDDDKFLSGVIHSVENSPTVEGVFDFTHTDEKNVINSVKEGKAVGVIIPEGFVKSIMYGENLPAKILFNSFTTTEYSMTRLIFDCGGKMLGNSQAGVYSFLDEYLHSYGESVSHDDLIGINLQYIAFVMNRFDFFTSEVVSSADGLDSLQYFLCSACLFFMMLMGISCSYLFEEDSSGLWKKLAIYGITPFHRTIVKLFSVYAVMLLSAAVFLGFGSAANSFFKANMLNLDITGILGIAAAALCVSAFTVFIFHAAKSRTAGSLLLFSLSFSMIFIGGGFIPSYFLPPVFTKISAFFPAYSMSRAIGAAFTHVISPQILFWLFIWFAVFITGSVISLVVRGE